jgi:predicted RNA-binding Zn-ribbon protein involved in translation (DUF1610 family)
VAAVAAMSDQPSTLDVVCVTCGYALRGLDAASKCPECGTEIARSLQTDSLSDADPGWVANMNGGIGLVALGTQLCVWSTVIFILLPLALYPWSSFELLLSGCCGIGAFGNAFGGLMLLPIGLFMATAVEPKMKRVDVGLDARRTARWSYPVCVLAIIVLWMIAPYLRWPERAFLTVFATVHVLGIGVVIWALLRWLAELVFRTPCRDLVTTARRLSIELLCLPLVTVFCFAMIVPTRGPVPLTSASKEQMIGWRLIKLASVVGSIAECIDACATKALTAGTMKTARSNNAADQPS